MQYKLKWMDVICNIEVGNMTKISRKADITYAHTVKLIKSMIKKQWIKIIPGTSKREYRFTWTEKGKRLVDACLLITQGLKESEDNDEIKKSHK